MLASNSQIIIRAPQVAYSLLKGRQRLVIPTVNIDEQVPYRCAMLQHLRIKFATQILRTINGQLGQDMTWLLRRKKLASAL